MFSGSKLMKYDGARRDCSNVCSLNTHEGFACSCSNWKLVSSHTFRSAAVVFDNTSSLFTLTTTYKQQNNGWISF